MPVQPCSEPLTVIASEGHVLVEGACGVAITLTPSAAIGSSDNLLDGAAVAIGQQRMPDPRSDD